MEDHNCHNNLRFKRLDNNILEEVEFYLEI